jgi:hypothetical protein
MCGDNYTNIKDQDGKYIPRDITLRWEAARREREMKYNARIRRPYESNTNGGLEEAEL